MCVCDNEIDSHGNDEMSKLRVIVENGAHLSNEHLQWLWVKVMNSLNWYEPVLTLHFLCAAVYEMLQGWACLEFPALKGADNCWWGSVLVYTTC